MKENEAPKKIYLLPRQGGDYAPYWRTDSQDGFGIGYVRTDAFIEEAEKYLKTKFIKDVSVLAGGTVNINFSAAIENFVKYMKGENE